MRDLHPRGRGERRARDQRAQLDELVRRDVERPQDHLVAGELDVAADVDRVAPGAPILPGACSVAVSWSRPDLPLVAPDVEVDVDDVVVGDREPAQRVADLERLRLVERAVVPDDPHPCRRGGRRRRCRRVGCTRGRCSRRAGSACRSRAPRRREIDSPGRERDLAVAAREEARERVLDVLVDERARRSAAIWTETSAWRSVYDFASAAPASARAAATAARRTSAATRSARHRRLRRRRLACARAKLTGGRRAVAVVDLEELALGEPERPGEQDGREDLDRVVEGQHGVVVDLPRDRDLVLGVLAAAPWRSRKFWFAFSSG